MCLTPFRVKNLDVSVPCGKCPECRARRASAWSFRLMQEERVSSSSYFITLTYDTKNVPLTRNGFMELSKRDLQLFFKRLRKVHVGLPIKYYAVGEYGSDTRRPHYHIILFNATQAQICPSWGLGHVHYGAVSGASVGYTLKYVSKPVWRRLHRNDDRLPQFSLMSKGLGKAYLKPEMINWHKNDLENRMYLNLEDGKKCSMPRYYKDRIYTEPERLRVGLATANRILSKQRKRDSLLSFEELNISIRNQKAAIDAAFQKQIVLTKSKI